MSNCTNILITCSGQRATSVKPTENSHTVTALLHLVENLVSGAGNTHEDMLPPWRGECEMVVGCLDGLAL